MKYDIVEGILDTAVDSIKDSNGYTDAVNTIIIAQLEKIWNLIINPGARESLGKDVSSAHKQELTKIVKELFLVLKLNAKASHAEANKEPSILDAGIKEFDNLLINDVTETTATLIGVALKSIMEEKQFERQLYHFLELINKSFKTGAKLSETQLTQFKEKERRISELLNEILTHSIRTALDKRLNSSNNPSREANEKHLQILRKNIALHLSSTKEAITTVSTLKEFQERLFLLFKDSQDELNELKEKVKADKDLDMGHVNALTAHYNVLANRYSNLGTILEDIQAALVANRPYKDLVQKAVHLLDDIQKYIDTLQPSPHVNYSSQGDGFVKQKIEDIVSARIRSYVDELVIMMRQPHNYRHLFHHLFIIPYLEGGK
jgi:hypothetical protein